MGIVSANPQGYISIPEQVTCKANGDETCRPVECIEIWQIIANSERL